VSAADVCAAAVAAVGVTGAWLSAVDGGEAGHLMQVTDAVSEQLAELQLPLGEGSSLDAYASGGPVLASDLSASETAGRWPVFARAALQAGAAAVFVFPLQTGAIRTRAMGLYRVQPGRLGASELGDALVFADTAVLLLLDTAAQAAVGAEAAKGPARQPEDLALHRAEIDQATGMLTEQLDVGIADTFARLRAYAYVNDLRLADVARDIVARRLRLRNDPGQPQDGQARRISLSPARRLSGGAPGDRSYGICGEAERGWTDNCYRRRSSS
jgi:ANTAR domain